MTTHNKTPAAVAAGTSITTSAAGEERGSPAGLMPAQTTNLFLPEDLEDVSRTRKLAESDLRCASGRRRLDQDLRGQASQGSRPRGTRVSLRASGL